MTNEQEQELRALYSQIPDDVLAVFEDYYEAQLEEALEVANEQAQASALGAADPNVVEADLVEELIFRTDGRDNAQGISFVPSPGGEYQLIPPKHNPFEAAPADEDMGQPRQGLSRRRRLFIMLGIVAVAVPMMCLLFASATRGIREVRGGGPQAAASPSTLAEPGDPNVASQHIYGVEPGTSAAPLTDATARRAQATYPSGLEIVLATDSPTITDTATTTDTARSSLVYDVVPVGGQEGKPWTPTIKAGTVAWLTDSYINAVFCLPPTAESLLRRVPEGTTVLMRRTISDVREYEIVRVREVGRQQTEVTIQQRAGMTLMACGTSGDARVIAEAVYVPPVNREVPPLAIYGNTVPEYLHVKVNDTDVQLRSDTVVQLTINVTFRNLSNQYVEWTDLTDHLLVGGEAAQPAGGVEWAAIAPNATQTATYSYLVPRSARDTLWEVIAPTGESMTVQVFVPPVE